MKLVILAGGYGTRLSEETGVRPKPMVEIGGRPIIWHIMKLYASYGIDDFVVAAGYRGEVIKDYFAGYFVRNSDITIDLKSNAIETHGSATEPWRVTIVDTGQDTMTGGRLKRVAPYLENAAFCMTYGDCLADVDISSLVEFHRLEGTLATVTAVQPPGRFGILSLAGDQPAVASFLEKPQGEGGWVNGGFFVLERRVLDYVDGDTIVWEHEPMERLARENQLAAYRHTGYWQPMDSLRDKMVLENAWSGGRAPWKRWG